MHTPKIGIVAMEGWGGGIVYTQNLVLALGRLPVSERPHITLFYESDPRDFQSIIPFVDSAVAYRPWYLWPRYLQWIVLFQKVALRGIGFLIGEAALELALAARKAHVDVMFPLLYARSGFMPCPLTWIPDFQHIDLPEMYSEKDRHDRETLSRNILGRAKNVVFSSEHAQEKANCLYGKVKPRSYVLHFTTVPKPDWYGDPALVKARYGLPEKYLIVCNQFWRHKDHKTLFKAVALLKQQGRPIHLVCTGATDDPRNPDLYGALLEQLKEDQITSYVHILGRIPRDDQMMLMRGALAVIQPSLYEGWSTVLEDARTLGVHIVVSDFPVHLEQGLPNALYFEKGNFRDCARAILETFDRMPISSVSAQALQEQNVLEFARQAMSIFNSALGLY